MPSEEQQSLVNTGEGKPDDTPKKAAMGAAACCGCCCCLYVVLVVVLAFVGNKILNNLSNDENYQVYDDKGNLVTPHNASGWWPGCHGEGAGDDPYGNCGTECCKCGLVKAYKTYNEKAGFTALKYSSREGPKGVETIKLTGWWLPAEEELEGKPAVVLQHGMGGTINDSRVHVLAFLLRSLGFSVLLTNLRDHGSAGRSGHGLQSWGLDYPYDTLGAWDYLVRDPDGILGGPRDRSKVGLMGISMGGFVSAAAFGMEGKVAALWLDGPLSSPKDLMRQHVSPYLSFMTEPVVGPSWWLAEKLSGLDLTTNIPETTLPKGPASNRPVFVMQSPDDTSCPMFMTNKIVETMRGRSGLYDVAVHTDLGGKCVEGNGNSHNHNVLQWVQPSAYRKELCGFFSRALLQKDCSAPELPGLR